MTPALRYEIGRALARYRRGHRLVLLFDYDGTLVPFADRPANARLSEEIREILGALAARPAVHVGVLSGRGLDDLTSMVAVPNLYYAGSGGLELDLRGRRISPIGADAAARRVVAAAETIERCLTSFRGAWIETKPLAFTIHYRQSRPEHVGSLRASVLRALHPFDRELRTFEGPMAFEVIAELGWSKGSAVRAIFEHSGGRPASLLYAGDDTNDADALECTERFGGIAVGIGPRAPATARFRLSDPAQLTTMLRTIWNDVSSAAIG